MAKFNTPIGTGNGEKLADHIIENHGRKKNAEGEWRFPYPRCTGQGGAEWLSHGFDDRKIGSCGGLFLHAKSGDEHH